MRHGTVVDPVRGESIDGALGVLMRGPGSYTGEDVFEIHAHGSPLVLERLVVACLEAGCRAARPGEFTLRAFLNGRLDLAQAEAVIDVVRARSNAGLELAVRQLSGWLSGRIVPLWDEIVGTLAHMEALVDFVEEDIPAQLNGETSDKLREVLAAIEALLEGAEQGVVLREGASLCIAGSPNVGKSSIMNGLLGLERSIVTSIPGTTRDTVEEMVQVRGIPFRLIDTAGITESADVVERIGIERSHSALATADVILLVFDNSRPFSIEDALALRAVREVRDDPTGNPPRLVIALNKNDLPPLLDRRLIEDLDTTAVIESSTVLLDGLSALRDALEQAALGSSRHEFVVGSVRHQDALRRAANNLHVALTSLEAEVPLDLVSFDVRMAAQALGEITGAVVDDELLDRIFRDFCIGK